MQADPLHISHHSFYQLRLVPTSVHRRKVSLLEFALSTFISDFIDALLLLFHLVFSVILSMFKLCGLTFCEYFDSFKMENDLG